MKRILIVLSLALVLLLPAALLAQAEDDHTAVFDFPANQVGWLQTTIWLDEGDEFSLTATGTINIWPNCEETKASAGYPDLDCQEVQEIPPDGTDVFGPGEAEHPLPGANVGALLIRIGEGEPFVAGEGGTFVAETSGLVSFAINDSQYQEDNQGSFALTITTPAPILLPPISGSWYESGVVVEAGQSFTLKVSGTINMWPNCQQTRVEQGYPNADCAALQALGPEGTDYFGPAKADYPLPGANVAALVGRIKGGPVFLIGKGGEFTAETGGPVLIAINDTAYWRQDDTGGFTITAIYHPLPATPEATATP